MLVLSTGAYSAPATSVGLDVSSSGFLLQSGDILVFTVAKTSENGVPGLLISVHADNGTEVNTTLNIGDEIAFNIGQLPDWNTNTSTLATLGGATHGGNFDMEYPAPYNETGPVDNSGPAYFMPVITIGDNTYWSDFTAVASNNGFAVISNSTHFAMSKTGSDFSLSVAWTKADGVMSFYHAQFTEDGIVKELKLVRADWDIIISQASTLGFSTTTPVLDYRVTEAASDNLNTAFNLSAIEINQNNQNEVGPLSAQGTFNVGDRLIANIYDYRTQDNMGYQFDLNGEQGAMTFNTSIDLPDTNPQQNGMFLYPQFVVTDTNIIEGYLHAAEFVSDSYTTSINATHFSIDFTHPNGTIHAEWDLSTGFMTSWRMNNSEDGALLALDLITGANVDDFNVNYDHITPGDGNTYQIIQLSNPDKNDKLPLDEDNSNPGVGYIAAGDLVYVDPLSSSVNLNDAPPTAFYNINATNGYQTNVSISFQYPGFDQVQSDGPPLLYFHFLGGNTAFFNWVETLYDATGGSYEQNATHIILSFSNDEVVFQEVFRLSDLAMVHYYFENTNDGVLLEINHISDTDIVVSNLTNSLNSVDTTPVGLNLPAYDAYSGFALMVFFIAIPILRRRK